MGYYIIPTHRNTHPPRSLNNTLLYYTHSLKQASSAESQQYAFILYSLFKACFVRGFSAMGYYSYKLFGNYKWIAFSLDTSL